MSSHKLRPIAIYLPQFHPYRRMTNGAKGFTEWTNVAKAKPFSGALPAAFARRSWILPPVAETRMAQAALAKEYGIYGFAITTTGLTAGGYWNAPSRRCLNRGARLSFYALLGQ